MDALAPIAPATRIALVEDDESLALLVSYNLEAAGYTVAWIADGVGAARRLAAEVPDLVLLDWGLPGVSGIELLRQLRRNAATSELPVLMLTGRTEPGDRQHAIALGADGYLTKPFAIGELMARLEALLAKSPRRHELAAT